MGYLLPATLASLSIDFCQLEGLSNKKQAKYKARNKPKSAKQMYCHLALANYNCKSNFKCNCNCRSWSRSSQVPHENVAGKYENAKMCKAKKHKANKKSGSTHKCARARVCVSVCLRLFVTGNNNTAHTPTSAASLPPTKERENESEQVGERSQHELSLR